MLNTENEKSLTRLTPEEEPAEMERLYTAFIMEDLESDEALRANLRLETLLLFTKNEQLRDEYLSRLLKRAMERALGSDKEQLNFREEFFVIHTILTVGEVVRNNPDLIRSPHTARIYGFTKARSSVVSGIAHQKFQEILAQADKAQKQDILDSVWANFES